MSKNLLTRFLTLLLHFNLWHMSSSAFCHSNLACIDRSSAAQVKETAMLGLTALCGFETGQRLEGEAR
jgi:hypothetical protein